MYKMGICLIAFCMVVFFSACNQEKASNDVSAQTATAGSGPIVKAGSTAPTLEKGAQATGEQDAENPVIKFESKEYDFGEIDQGEKVEHTFSFKNTGDALLVINKVRSS